MKTFFIALAIFIAAPAATAQVTITEPWIRGTVPHQSATGAFMQITAAADSRLVAAHSAAASRVEIHEMKLEDKVMKMRQIDALQLPAGTAVALKPGSYHLMLTGLKSQLKEGDIIPVTLVFETGSKERRTVELNVPVRPLHAPAGHQHGAR